MMTVGKPIYLWLKCTQLKCFLLKTLGLPATNVTKKWIKKKKITNDLLSLKGTVYPNHRSEFINIHTGVMPYFRGLFWALTKLHKKLHKKCSSAQTQSWGNLAVTWGNLAVTWGNLAVLKNQVLYYDKTHPPQAKPVEVQRSTRVHFKSYFSEVSAVSVS